MNFGEGTINHSAVIYDNIIWYYGGETKELLWTNDLFKVSLSGNNFKNEKVNHDGIKRDGHKSIQIDDKM